MWKSKKCDKYGEGLIERLNICLVDHFRHDVLTGRVTITNSLVLDPRRATKDTLVVPVVLRDYFKERDALVHVAFEVNKWGDITTASPRVLPADAAQGLLKG